SGSVYDVEFQLSRAAAAQRIALLELMTRDPPRTLAQVRDAQFPPGWFESLHAIVVLAPSETRALALATGLELTCLPDELLRIDTARLPERMQSAVAHAGERVRERFPETAASLVDAVCAVIPCLVLTDDLRADEDQDIEPALEGLLSDRARDAA